MPIERIERSIPLLASRVSRRGGKHFSEAIMTTDSFKKHRSAEFTINGKTVRIGASAKGAGMIEPSMATMLCFITTDADVSKSLLAKILKHAIELSFTRISVDGDQSTNDTVLLCSNGLSQVKIRKETDPGFRQLQQSVTEICCFLAEQMVRDGEGATKLMKVRVSEAKSENDARKLCRDLTNSLLLKCALFGEKPIWGRILSTIGAAQIACDPSRLRIDLQGIPCFQKGEPDFDVAKKLRYLMKKKEIEIRISLGAGQHVYSMLGSDLGFEYVEINRS